MPSARSAGRAVTRAIAALDRLDAAASDAGGFAQRAAGSRWCVGEHLEHLVAANALCLAAAGALVRGDDARIVARGSPTAGGRLVLALGWIPRGKGRAPESTLPSPGIDSAGLRRGLAENRERLVALAPAALAAAQGGLPHPILGVFDAVQWVRFTEVHTRHHLRIVDEIIAAC